MKFICLIWAAILMGQIAESSTFELCPTIEFKEKLPFQLSKDEIQVVCGDKSATDSSSRSWSEIAPNQAILSLKAMFQQRGFHKPSFDLKDGILHVILGEATRIKSIILSGAPDFLDKNRKREIVGEILTPKKLDDLKDWLLGELKHSGYPCPRTQIGANFNTGEIFAEIFPGQRLKIIKINAQDIPDLHPGVIRRFDAFHLGEDFDQWNIAITENRILEDELIVGTHFSELCEPEGVTLNQTAEPGLPRLFRFGIGIDSEQGPLFKVSSHYSRMNKRGSSLDTDFNTSFRIQEFTSAFKWYIVRDPSRFFITPTLDIKRDSEPDYTTFTTKIAMLPSFTWDDEKRGWQASLGPSYEIDQTLMGNGPAYSQSLFLNETLQIVSHGFEFYKSNPQQGYKLWINSSFSSQAFVSSVTANQISLGGEMLFNIGNFSPPAMVFGVRGSLGTTLTPNGGTDLANLPIPFRYYLGGNQDLRGFSRQELPDNGGLGAMSEAFLGMEMRFMSLLPFNLQPYLFTDGGLLGSQPSTLDWPLYWSPGLGIRWDSPIGVFRLEGAHGFSDSPKGALDSDRSHWQFYVSYGEEF